MSVRSQLIAVAQPAGLRAQRFAGLQRLQPAGKPLRCSLCLPPAWARPACSRNGLPGKWSLTIKLNDAGHDDPGACPRCSSTRLQARVGRHVTAAAGRALVTISADHPSWGDGWVVCTTARCGNVDDTDNRIGAAAAPADAAGTTGGGTCRVRSRCRASGGGPLRSSRLRIAGRITRCPRGQAGCRAAAWRSHRERSFVMSDKTVVLAILDSEASADAAFVALKDSGTHGTRRRSGRGVQQLVRSFACRPFTARGARHGQ